MKTLFASAPKAVELFAFRARQETAAMEALLGGLDGFVFTGGIGEQAAEARVMVCERLHWLGMALGAATNAGGAGRISTSTSRVEVHVIPTDEEVKIAQHSQAILG